MTTSCRPAGATWFLPLAVALELLGSIAMGAGCSYRPLPSFGGPGPDGGTDGGDAGDAAADRASPGAGGTGAGGTGAGGTGAGGTGAGGAGGRAACQVPAQPVPCGSSWSPSYAFDSSAGHCVPFAVGECGGSINRFESLADCEAACLPQIFACTRSNDCTLGTLSCCGPATCTGPVDLTQYIAVNRAFAAYQQKDACPSPHYCGPGPPSPADALDLTCQYVIATCEAGRCRATDLRETAVVACRSDAECRLRVGSRCCSDCGTAMIAISSETLLDQIVCADGASCSLRCPSPPGFAATCQSGQCRVIHGGP